MAVSRNKNESENAAAHWRYYLKKYYDGTFDLDREYDLFVGNECQDLLGQLSQKDTTIHDFFKLKKIEDIFPELMSYHEMLVKLINGASLARYGDAEFDITFSESESR